VRSRDNPSALFARVCKVFPIVGLLIWPLSTSGLRAQVSQVDLNAEKTAHWRADMDTTCAACADFYMFANGGWLKRTTVPATDEEVSTFSQLYDTNQAVLRDLIERAAEEVQSGVLDLESDRGKIGVYYDACVDSAAVERRGTHPLEASMSRIGLIRTAADLPRAFAELERTDGIAPFTAFMITDLKNSSRIIPSIVPRGLSLPSKNYYTSTDTAMQRIRNAFVTHLAKMFELSGETTHLANVHAQSVLHTETSFAQAAMDLATMRDPNNVYHPMSLAQLDSMTPHIKWRAFLVQQGGPQALVGEANVTQPEYFKAIDGLLSSIAVDDWKTFLRWRLMNASAQLLPRRFADEHFGFEALFSGQQEQLPRWKTCTSLLTQALGFAIGREYARNQFSPEAKARAQEMVATMVSVLHDRIAQLDWMSDSTKRQALIKLDAFHQKIGYPDHWIDYSGMKLARGKFYENVKQARIWYIARNWSKVGRPIDKTEWAMTPFAVNAYYTASWNELVFPAGILQPPFYNPNGDDAANYGSIGAIMGHEMSHGFDDQGRRFDAQGNLRDWWTKEDSAKYKEQAQRVVDQFTEYTVVDSSTHVNGKLTLGENIADLGGLKIAYIAMEKSFAIHGRPGNVEGFTPEQRFFLAWARTWRSLAPPESIKAQVNTDSHAPAMWRVNGPLSNMPEFAKAWGCKDTDAMVRRASLQAIIW
jgi:putative endopeptidase